MKKFLNKLIENRILDFVVIFCVSVVLMFQFFNKNNDIYAIEGKQYLIRAYWTYQSMKQNTTGNVISYFINNFGYSLSLFEGQLHIYLLICFGIIFNSFNIGFKVLILIAMFLAGCMMYKLIYQLTDNKNTAILAGIIYITSPYFFTDIYVRHAIDEVIAFIFIPLVFLGLYNLYNTEKNHYYFILGMTGLILTKNDCFVITTIFAIIYSLVNVKNLSSTRVKRGFFIDLIFIISITSFYWMPLIQTRFFANYKVYENDNIINKEEFINTAINIRALFITPNNTRFVLEVGFPIIVMLAFSMFTFKKMEDNKKEYMFFLLSGIFSMWIATKYFPWSFMPQSFLRIQYPWRMLQYSTFFFTIVASINMSTVITNFRFRDVLIISSICILYIFSRYYVVQYNDNIVDVKDYAIGQVTGQNGENIPGMGDLKYLPKKAFENTFYIATKQDEIKVMSNNCTIENQEKDGSYFTAKITTLEQSTELELPYIYYPGYTVRFDGMIMHTHETKNGFVGINIDKNESGKLELNYTQTSLMKFSKIISLMVFICYLVYVWKKH